jgi:hypothetical protein
MGLEEAPCARRLARRDLPGRAGHHHLAAGMAAVRPEVDDVVGCLDHVERVLDENHGMAGVT